MGGNNAFAANNWDAHADKWSSSVQQVTLSACTKLLKNGDAIIPFDAKTARVLDNGAGSGQVTSILKSQYPDTPVVASDVSKGMVGTIDKKIKEEGWKNIETLVQDCQSLTDLSKESFSHVFCTFVITFVDRPDDAIKEMYRVLQPGGAVGIATWSEVSYVSCWEHAVRKVQGNDGYTAPTLYPNGTASIDWMKETMQQAGFVEVEVEFFRCYKPLMTSEKAIDEFYNVIINNPTVKTLVEGFDEDFIEKTKPFLGAAYEEKYNGGKDHPFELAVLSVGKKPE